MTTDQAELGEFDKKEMSEPDWGCEKFIDLMESMRNGLYKKKDFYGQGNQIVKMGELFASEFITNQDEMDRLELSDKELSKHKLEKGDLLFARRSYVREGSGKCSIMDNLEEPLVPESSIIRARPNNEKIIPEFIYYFFKSDMGRNEIGKIVRQTAVSGIAQSDLKEIEIPVPPKRSQAVIVEYLKTLDEKIRVNNRINILLEDISKEIFKHRFVDFKPYEDFRNSEMGEIPKNFEVKAIGEILSLEYGNGLSKDKRDGGEFPVYGANGVNGHHSDYLVESPGIIVGRKGTIGTVTLSQKNFWCIDTTFYVEPKKEFNMLFYYHLLKNGLALKHLGSDSAVPGLNRNTIHDQKVILPPKSDIEKYVDTIMPFYDKMRNINEENEQLENLRDALLPKLMSRDIRVNNISLEDLEVSSEV